MADLDASIDAGYRALDEGDDARALEFFAGLGTALEATAQQRFQLHYGHGMALGRLGRYDEALVEHRAALVIGPQSAAAAMEVAECFRLLDRPQDAMNHYNRAVAMGGRDPLLHYNRACVAVRLGDHDVMLQALGRAIELDEQNRSDAVEDSDFAPVLGLARLRVLLRLPPVRPPAWLPGTPSSIFGYRQLAAEEIASLSADERPLRIHAHDRVCELWEVRLPAGERVRRRLFGYNQVVRPLISRGGGYVALELAGEITVIEVATDRQWALTNDNLATVDGTGRLDSDNQIVGWSVDDQLLFRRRPVHMEGAELQHVVARRVGDEWTLHRLGHAVDPLVNWSGSRPTFLEKETKETRGVAVEVTLDGARRELFAVDCDEHGLCQLQERAGRYTFQAGTQVWLTDASGQPRPLTEPASFAFHQHPTLSDDAQWLCYVAGGDLVLRSVDGRVLRSVLIPGVHQIRYVAGGAAVAVSARGVVHVVPLDRSDESWLCDTGVLA